MGLYEHFIGTVDHFVSNKVWEAPWFIAEVYLKSLSTQAVSGICPREKLFQTKGSHVDIFYDPATRPNEPAPLRPYFDVFIYIIE